MDDQKDDGAQSNEITTPKIETTPIPATIIDARNTANSPPLIKRRWFKVTIGFAGIALLVGALANVLQIPNSALELYGRIIKKGWQPPRLPDSYESVAICFGKLCKVVSVKDLSSTSIRVPIFFAAAPQGGVFMFPKPPSGTNFTNLTQFNVRIKGRRVYLEVNVPTDTGLVTLDANEPKRQIPFDWDWNSNGRAVEIINGRGYAVCRVVYARPDRIEIEGCFGSSTQYVAWFGSMMSVHSGVFPPAPTNATLLKSAESVRAAAKPIFKYPSGLHQGELAR